MQLIQLIIYNVYNIDKHFCKKTMLLKMYGITMNVLKFRSGSWWLM